MLPAVMTWDDFWKLIATLGGRADYDSCTRLTNVLALREVQEITGFGERMAESLYRLDQERFGRLPVANMGSPDAPFPQSGDHFLYARCAVVAAGRDVYEGVFADPSGFGPFTAPALAGEWLLYVAQNAFEVVTGEEWDRRTQYSFESYSNRDGWPRRG